MNDLWQQIVSWVEASRYLLLFLGAFFEGPAVMIGAGFLYRLGQFYLLPLYLCLVFGDFTADVVWYVVGRFGARSLINKYGKFFNLTPEIMKKVETRFHTYQNMILWVSKLTMGFGFSLATLLTAGMLKISFKKFATINLIGGLIWVAFLVLVGYVFGNIYYTIPTQYKFIFVIAIAALVIMAIKLVNRFLVNTKI